MKKEASRARAARMKAAQRLIEQNHSPQEPSPLKAPPPPPMRARRMVQPVELQVTIVTA